MYNNRKSNFLSVNWSKRETVHDVCATEVLTTDKQNCEFDAIHFKIKGNIINFIAHNKYKVAKVDKSALKVSVCRGTIDQMLAETQNEMEIPEYVSLLYLKFHELDKNTLAKISNLSAFFEDYKVCKGNVYNKPCSANYVVYHPMSEEILKFNVPDSHWKHTLGTIMYFGSELNHPDRIYEKHAKRSPEKIDELTKGKIFTILEGPYVFIFILEPTYFSLPNHHFFSMPFLPSGTNINKSMLKIFCTDHNGIGVPMPYDHTKIMLLLAKHFTGKSITSIGANHIHYFNTSATIYEQEDEDKPIPLFSRMADRLLKGEDTKYNNLANEFCKVFANISRDTSQLAGFIAQNTRARAKDYFDEMLKNQKESQKEKYEIIIREKDATIASLDETAYVAKCNAYVAEADAKVALVKENYRQEKLKMDSSVQNEVKTLRDRIESLERQLSTARANTPDSGKKAKWNDTRKSRGDDDHDDAGGSNKKKRKAK
jgi:hypothetical protein